MLRTTTAVVGLMAMTAAPALCAGFQLPGSVLPTSGAGAILQQQGDVELLTDPFLQAPTDDSVRVVWFTEFEGSKHVLLYGEGLDGLGESAALATASFGRATAKIRVTFAGTSKLSRSREDAASRVPGRTYTEVTERPVWRHEAVAEGLEAGQRVPYAVLSIDESGAYAMSAVYTLAPKPAAGAPTKILLTSDHQSKPMTPANMQKLEETVGQVDVVLFAGDLVNVPDRASEWFDDERGGAFFPSLQGNASLALTRNGVTTIYRGGEVIQHAPVYPVIGNHEVMGRNYDAGLNAQFNAPVPGEVAERVYDELAASINPAGDPQVREDWIVNNSFNADTYLELFTLPESEVGGEKFYAETIGDVRLVSLYATRIWRSRDTSGARNGKYQEGFANHGDELSQGWGTFIFEPVEAGSAQYEWLEQELMSDEFQSAKYKVVMLHHPSHSLGGNVIPPFTDPVRIEERDENGEITRIRYEYPKQDNYLIRDLEPLLEQAGVDLVFSGHNHTWNRFEGPTGINYLETSNVGNTYGSYMTGRSRRGDVPPEPWIADYYDPYDDPYGLAPIMPSESPVTDPDGTPLPYVADNNITAFTVFDTASGQITTWAYDTRTPEAGVWVLDRFELD